MRIAHPPAPHPPPRRTWRRAALLALLLPACHEIPTDPGDALCPAGPPPVAEPRPDGHGQSITGRRTATPGGAATVTPAGPARITHRQTEPAPLRPLTRLAAGSGPDPASGAPTGEAETTRTPGLLRDGLAALGPVPGTARPPILPRKRFSFAVFSDTHEAVRCALGQGRWLLPAIQYVNARRPAFVIGLGDLVAGGGDCDLAPRDPGWASTQDQLAELKRELLDRLEVPFVPVSGNHDLAVDRSRKARSGPAIWRRFWRDQAASVLPAARSEDPAGPHRFVHRGVGFALLTHTREYGPEPPELAWIARVVKPGDLVFRHLSPYGLTCTPGGFCGDALKGFGGIDPSDLPEALQRAGARVLFSGHTHAFYDGVCDGLRYVNTGTLGGRSLETLKGWHRSPWQYRQAFVWVDVLEDDGLRVSLLVWSPEHERFEVFDKGHLPRRLLSRREARPGYDEGVNATCVRPAATATAPP